MTTTDTMPASAVNPTAAELDALPQGSIAIILDGPEDRWPEAFLRYGSGWTLLEAASDSNDIPSAGLLILPDKIVQIIWGTEACGQGRAVTSEEELLALPAGSLLRGHGIRRNPAWPKLLVRVHSYPGNDFAGSSPNLDNDPISAGAALRFHRDLTVIWEPQ